MQRTDDDGNAVPCDSGTVMAFGLITRVLV